MAVGRHLFITHRNDESRDTEDYMASVEPPNAIFMAISIFFSLGFRDVS